MNEPQADRTRQPGPSGGTLDRALSLVEFLRSRCPWDAAQTHHSLRRYLLEESHEVVDAIDGGDDDALRDELGDLLLNLAFQIVIGEERSAFGRADVIDALEAKMRRRHPHLYGGGAARSWEAVKAAERDDSAGGTDDDGAATGLLAEVIPGIDPVAHANRVQARVATVGFDWPDASGAWDKVVEEVGEVSEHVGATNPLLLEEEIGDLLFAVVNFARLSGIHPTTALTRANLKFTRRFTRLEALARLRGVHLADAGLEALDELWETVKTEER